MAELGAAECGVARRGAGKLRCPGSYSSGLGSVIATTARKSPPAPVSAVARLQVVRNVKMLDLVTLRVSEDSLLHETSAHLKHDCNLNYFKNGGGQ